ncbi:hypothetical protein ACLX1H_008945 [Fusarium chlamydosporum]
MDTLVAIVYECVDCNAVEDNPNRYNPVFQANIQIEVEHVDFRCSRCARGPAQYFRSEGLDELEGMVNSGEAFRYEASPHAFGRTQGGMPHQGHGLNQQFGQFNHRPEPFLSTNGHGLQQFDRQAPQIQQPRQLLIASNQPQGSFISQQNEETQLVRRVVPEAQPVQSRQTNDQYDQYYAQQHGQQHHQQYPQQYGQQEDQQPGRQRYYGHGGFRHE